MEVVEGQTYLVLDCEGLFSQHRTAQDEIRIRLALAVVSDGVIFNTDISGIIRHSLFGSMTQLGKDSKEKECSREVCGSLSET
jgi:hypothetical protein